MKRVFIFLILVLCTPFLLADTTFFEGDLGYRDDFIMDSGVFEEVIIEPEVVELLTVNSVGGGGYFAREEYNESLVCAICSESLREHISSKRELDYDEGDLGILMEEINRELGADLSINQVAYIIENFEDECDAPIPLLGAVTGGRYADLFSPVSIFLGVIVFVFLILIYLVFRKIRKLKIYNLSKKKRLLRKKRNK